MRLRFRRIKIGSFIISIQCGKPKEDEEVRKEAIEFMARQSIDSTDRQFTGMELHYKLSKDRKVGISRGTMIIRM